MPKKKENNIVNTGFVPGIYNYCDRWCERCKFQSRCMSFTMGKKLKERAKVDFDEELPEDDDVALSRLKSIFDSTYEVLRELAEEKGIAIEDIYRAENIDKGFWGEDYEGLDDDDEEVTKRVEREDMICCNRIYEALADKCQESIYQKLDEEEEKGNGIKTKEIDEALVEISWYLDLIHAKMKRALYGFHIYADKINAKQEENDYNGSAKVALLAIEISYQAWSVLKNKVPYFQQDIKRILVVLEQMLRDLERRFPDARNFCRPGFDQ
ncbi:hypothetical protein [uncultured Sanguibacteroides sp.]|uniref:hypothetical protein n=1 Tax=uncultured Sanguibacteroides sp. TaxID=1635151 RepID=UPI0025D71394|nr:hypothetical protein [uncultured Sanguibacteroides sp.]